MKILLLSRLNSKTKLSDTLNSLFGQCDYEAIVFIFGQVICYNIGRYMIFLFSFKQSANREYKYILSYPTIYSRQRDV